MKRQTHEEFIRKLANVNPNILVVSKYNKSSEKVKCVCKLCGHEWEATPDNIKRNPTCPACRKKKRTSL